MPEERRLVTVLFADVTGSTGLGETLDPEDLRVLLARYFSIAREVVQSHGGTLEKFIGDAVMAVFGLPTAHGDDAVRAIAAGVELRDRVRVDPDLGERLPIRIGLNTGEVVASREAESAADFLVTGDAVNVAARLVQAAESWSIVAGERTVRAAPEFDFSSLDVVDARGKSVVVRAARVLGRRPSQRRPLPLLGRGPDIAQLELVADRSFGEERPYLVSVVAPAGTGKTRLLEEFLARVKQRTPDCVVAVAQCLPYGQRLTFWPLRAILHSIVGVDEDTPPDRLREAVVRRLTELGVPEPTQVAGRLLATIGAGEEDISDRTELYAAWRTTFERAAAERPLVVVFEDLHWSSDSFLDLVEHVTQPRGLARLLMIVLTRGELLDRRPGWGGGRRNHVSLALDPLDEGSIADLVRHLLESASPEVISAVAARAEGNPFYAGELVRTLIDRLGPRASADEVERSLASLPDTVQATILARLDALPPPERRALQLGSVFGRSFRIAGLAALEPETAARLDDAVGALLDRDMIRQSGGDSHAFRHILIREVAYGTLPRAERARLHLAAGRWLEEAAAGVEEAYAELIAFHYREAASLSALLPADEAADAASRAVTWLRRAAETAIAAAAHVEAGAHLAKALEWAPADVLPEIHERRGDTMIGGDATVEAYSAAYRLARETGRAPNDVLRVLAKLIEYEARFQGSVGTRSSIEAMDSLVSAGHALMESATDPAARSRFLIGVGFLPWWRRGGGVPTSEDVLEEAAQSARRGLEYAEEAGDATLKSSALDALGSLALERGSWRESLGYAQARLALRDRLVITERIDAESMGTWVSAALGLLPEADQLSRDALVGIQPGQAPSMVLHLVSWRAYVLFERGRWDEAVAMARRGESLWIDIGRPAALYAIRGFLAAFDVARARREPDASAAWRGVCEAIFDQTPGIDDATVMTRLYLDGDVETLARDVARVPNRHFFERYAGWIAMCSDRGVAIDELALDAWRGRATHNGERILLGEVLRALAVVRRDRAAALQALEIFEECGSVPRAARVRCDLGLLESDDAMFNEGARVLETLGDVDQLERYEAKRRNALGG